MSPRPSSRLFPPSKQDKPDRRRHYRVPTMLRLRLRIGAGRGAADFETNIVGHYEELIAAGQRHRKELSLPGKQFHDRLMQALDALCGHVARLGDDDRWSPRFLVDADVSLGGIGFDSDVHQEVGADVQVEFAFPSSLTAVPFIVDAKILRAQQIGVGRWHLGLEFDRLNAGGRERLGRLLFQQQRLRLREDAG